MARLVGSIVVNAKVADGAGVENVVVLYCLHTSFTSPPATPIVNPDVWSNIYPTYNSTTRVYYLWTCQASKVGARWLYTTPVPDLSWKTYRKITEMEWIGSFGVPVDADAAYLMNFLAIKDEDGNITTMLTTGVDDVPNIATGMAQTDGTAEALKQAARNAPFTVWKNGMVGLGSTKTKYITISTSEDYVKYMPFSNGMYRLNFNPQEGFAYVFSILPEVAGVSSVIVALPQLTFADNGTKMIIKNMSGQSITASADWWDSHNSHFGRSILLGADYATYEFEYIHTEYKTEDGYRFFAGAWTYTKTLMNNFI